MLTGLRGHDGFASLDYELVPPARADDIAKAGGGRFHWRLSVEDDSGHVLATDGRGSLDVEAAGPSSPGTRDIGDVSPDATKLFLRFQPARAVSTGTSHEVHASFDLRTLELSFEA